MNYVHQLIKNLCNVVHVFHLFSLPVKDQHMRLKTRGSKFIIILK